MQIPEKAGRTIPGDARPPGEPVFNLPASIVWLGVVLVAIHAVRFYLLSGDVGSRVLIAFAFIPARYGELAPQIPYPLAAVWSPVTYALLHGSWLHLWMNVLWMAAFGSPLARRFGPVRFAAISVLAALAGAVLHFAFYPGEMVPMIGASACVSGYMGAAARFAFQGRSAAGLNVHGPALSLAQSFTNRKFLIFLFVWFALNFLFGSGVVSIGGMDARIAWQAHVGGFLAGIFAFSFLDRERKTVLP